MAETAVSRASARIIPLLSVRRGKEAIAFYQRAFGAVETFHIEDDSGAVVSMLTIGGAEFWLSDESPEHANFSPESLGGSTTRLLLVVDDPDASQAQALTAGATEVLAVGDRYGWRYGRVVDPYGHHWEIGRRLG